MGYMAMSIIVYFVMNMLGEMTTYLPVAGVSVPYFITRFTEPSLGFAVGTFSLGLIGYVRLC
jgi:amino acid transporter